MCFFFFWRGGGLEAPILGPTEVKMIIALDAAYHRLRYLCAAFLGPPATEAVPGTI